MVPWRYIKYYLSVGSETSLWESSWFKVTPVVLKVKSSVHILLVMVSGGYFKCCENFSVEILSMTKS